jgi:hypothetical protein
VSAQWKSQGERWRLLAPGGSVVIAIPAGPRAIRRAAARVRALPAGAPVVLLDHRRGSLRARRVAAASGCSIEREYVALPSLRTAVMFVEDAPSTLRFACRSLATPPPGLALAHGPAQLALWLLRRYPRLAPRLAAGRIVVGAAA